MGPETEPATEVCLPPPPVHASIQAASASAGRTRAGSRERKGRGETVQLQDVRTEER